jgi:ribonucleotide monophosphatase NagD (HAD superfamily)
MGGQCTSFGKPNPEHFEACLEQLGIEASRCAHVGDSLHHDIYGANAANIASILVTSGIHAQELETEFGELPDTIKLDRLFEQEQIIPTHVISAFRF